MKFDVKNRFTDKAQFTAEIECNKAATDGVKLGLAMQWGHKHKIDLSNANLRSADLCGVDLRGADLRWVDLSNADLRDADLRGADLSNADLRGTDLRGADLSRVDLSNANLSGADLRWANLHRANLRDAKYGNGIPMTVEPLQLLGLRWPVLILDNHIEIGCQLHSIDKWEKFTDSCIEKMDPNALEFWRAHRETILTLARQHEPEDA